MKTVIVDSSVIVKWLNQQDEADVDKADRILEDTQAEKVQLIAPELAKYEVGNVLLKGKQLTPKETIISLAALYALPIRFVADSENLSRETFSLAHAHGITYYDASFLALAKQFSATLVTNNVKHQGKAKNVLTIALKDY